MSQRRGWEDTECRQIFRLCVLQISVLNPAVHGELQPPTMDAHRGHELVARLGAPASCRHVAVRVRKLAGKDAGAPSSGSWRGLGVICQSEQSQTGDLGHRGWSQEASPEEGLAQSYRSVCDATHYVYK